MWVLAARGVRHWFEDVVAMQADGQSDSSSDAGIFDDDFEEVVGAETMSRAERAELRSQRRCSNHFMIFWLVPNALRSLCLPKLSPWIFVDNTLRPTIMLNLM